MKGFPGFARNDEQGAKREATRVAKDLAILPRRRTALCAMGQQEAKIFRSICVVWP